MNRFQIAGVLWLVAAILGAAVSVAYRTEMTMDTSWYAITLVGSAIAAVLGILLLWRPSSTTVLLSTIGAVAWVLMYGALTLIQSAKSKRGQQTRSLGLSALWPGWSLTARVASPPPWPGKANRAEIHASPGS